MKTLILSSLFLLAGASACTPATQQKVNNAADIVECKVEVLKPYLDKLTSDQFMAAVAEKNYFDMLSTLGVDPAEVEATVAALKACHK